MKTLSCFLFAALLLPLPLLGQQPSKQLRYNDWTVILSDNKEDLIAVTSQDDDKFLAYRCFTRNGQCGHSIAAATTCKDGEQYPVLINASSGSLMVSCVCSVHDNLYELIPMDFDGFHRALLESTGYIGFAIPLESGKFKVVRFSLSGAKRALPAAETAARKSDSAEYQ